MQKQYGIGVRLIAAVVGSTAILAAVRFVWAITSDEHPIWLILAVVPIVALGILFLDAARRGEDPPWFYDMWDLPEHDPEDSERKA